MATTGIPTRRTFMQTAGAALSVPLAGAAAPALAATTAEPTDTRLALLEDLEAIRALNQELARCVTAGDREAMAALCADPENVQMDPDVRGITSDGFGERDVIDVAPDRQTASALLSCTVHLERAIGPECPLVEMARQQGGGVVRWTEHRVFEVEYVRRDGRWSVLRYASRLP